MRHPGEYLHRHRIKVALWVAFAEGMLVIVDIIPHIAVYILAVVAIVFYGTAGRHYRSTLGRQLSWVFAASQAAAVLVPILWFVAKWVAVLTIGVIAVAALVFLFTEHDRPHRDRPSS